MRHGATVRAALGAAVLAALTGLTAGCSEPPPPAATDVIDPGSPAPRPTPTPSQPPAPLSGAPVASEAVVARAAVAVPIRVTADTTPAGLAAADLIYQEYAESDSLHLTAVFHSRDAGKVGPVAEIRPVDVRTLAVLRPVVGYAGGPKNFLAQLTDSGLRGATPGQRRSAFPAGHASTAALRALAPAGGVGPPAIFDYATPGTPLASQGTAPASQLTVAAPGRPAQVWRYDAATSTWRGRVGKSTVAAASVIVLTMEYRTLTVRKPARREMPGAKVFGGGAATVVSGPVGAKANWRKPGQEAVCHVTDLAGDQVHPLPGTTWVVYAPSKAKVTVT
ncbi:MAG TPA: DUF3048 domain-containing protein [Pilimelia sp.]|nr:DUF3048 domain-containing protein [Pilimelia sp.]